MHDDLIFQDAQQVKDLILRAAAAVTFHLESLHEIIKEISPACCIHGQMRRDTRHNLAAADRFGVIIIYGKLVPFPDPMGILYD